VPVRLICSDEQAPLGVLVGGTDVEVIEMGTSTCAGWLLVGSADGLTWLHPSVLAPIEATTTTGAEATRP
jgi:hypothetical protein